MDQGLGEEAEVQGRRGAAPHREPAWGCSPLPPPLAASSSPPPALKDDVGLGLWGLEPQQARASRAKLGVGEAVIGPKNAQTPGSPGQAPLRGRGYGAEMTLRPPRKGQRTH